MSLATLAKITRGKASLDEMLEFMSSLGVEMEVSDVEPEAKSAGLDGLKELALRGDSKVTALRATMKDGKKMVAVLVIPGL